MDRALRLGPIQRPGRSAQQWLPYELTFSLEGQYTNPFDPDQIDVAAEIECPDGERLAMPAFFYQDYALSGEGPVPSGDPCWKVRFSPMEPGEHRIRIVARNGGETASSPWRRFVCEPSGERGPVRVGLSNPLYCEFHTGEPYVPLGINLFVFTKLGQGIPANRLNQCLAWMEKLSRHRGNFVRLRMDSWWLAIEMSPDPVCGYGGLGRYHQQTCWEIDRIYQQARAKGIYIMHCLDNANGNVNETAQAWRRPYNLYLEENGGCCSSPREFWTKPEAKRHVRNKLRYCLARWGAHPNLMCWEFWNEVSCREETIGEAAAWHEEMAAYLREKDPYDRPVTTSLMGDKELAEEIWSLPEIDIVQYHHYNSSEMTPEVASMTCQAVEAFGKPFFLGEYGVAPAFRPGNCDYDAKGIHMHNGLWAAAFSGGLGGGAMWHVKDYVDPMDLWFHYEGLTAFFERVPWTAPDLEAFHVENPVFAEPPATHHPVDLPLKTSMTYAFKRSPETDFVVERDGRIANWEKLRPHLYATKGRKSPPVFHVNATRPFEFLVRVHCSVGDESNRLLVRLDGKLLVERPFPAGKEHNEQSEYIATYENWRTPYDGQVAIQVPPGPHGIRCEALGKDRLEVSYLLRGAVSFEEAGPVRVLGLRTGEAAFLWFQNKSSTWRTAWEGKDAIPAEGLECVVPGLPDGVHAVHWFDPWEGRFLDKQQGKSEGNFLALSIPPITRDIACVVGD